VPVQRPYLVRPRVLQQLLDLVLLDGTCRSRDSTRSMNRAKNITTKGTANTNQTVIVSVILAQVGTAGVDGDPVRRV